LSQRKDPENYPHISFFADLFEQIRLYRQWEFGRISKMRQPQRTDMRSSVLEEDFSNFCLFLSRLFRTPNTKQRIIEAFKEVYAGISDIQIDVSGANAELFVFEGENAIPAIRLSDGTLRYLVLTALLLDPEPAPLICLEEPELGLHSDLIGNVAKLLKDASTRTQLIVTTHSELLVDAFSDQVESIVVCEKENGATTFKRLEPERLNAWLEDYRLGDVWLRGEFGGVRW
jgi:predicted ATPase